ncbi:MAG: TolC family protein, partial [Bilophila sp.]
NYSDRGGPGNQWTSSFDVMGTVRWNLFNSGADAAETKAALARVRQSRQFLYDFIDSLKLEVEDTWTGYISATEQYGHYTDAIGFNTQTRDSYLEQFMIGQRSLLDVLDAE